MPEVSVIMPVCNGARYLRESLDSVEAQTFTDWELLAINEYGSGDGSAGIVEEYAARDPRIRLIQNTHRLGLAASLNKGFRLAQGKYLARLDADDLALPQRFEKQYAFMESRPEVGICGSYQHHFGKDVDWVHKPPVRPEDMKVTLLFSCNLCHSTLMLRRSVVFENDLFYDGSYLAEDFELWTRAILVTEIANIPEVLGAYRKDGVNITDEKKQGLIRESRKIVANNLKRLFGIELRDDQACYFQGWENHFRAGIGRKRRQEQLADLESILREMYRRNEQCGAADSKSLLNQLAVVWRHAKYDLPEDWSGEELVNTLDEVFMDGEYASLLARYRVFRRNNPHFSLRVKKIIRKLILFPVSERCCRSSR